MNRKTLRRWIVRRTRYILLLSVVCLSVTAYASETEPLNVLIFGGGNAHQFKQDVDATMPFLKKNGMIPNYTETIELLNYDFLKNFDVLVMHCCRNHPSDDLGKTPDTLKKSLPRFLKNGGGIVFLHCAVASFSDWKEWIDLTGGVWVWETSSHDRYQTMKSTVIAPDHPVVRGLPKRFEFDDEFYHTLKLLPSSKILIEGTHDKKGKQVTEPLVWIARDRDRERAMTIIYGHDMGSWGHDIFRKLLKQSIEWSAHRQ